MPKGSNPKKKKPRNSGRIAGLDARIAAAFNHPTRTEIIAVLNDRCASPSELEKILGIDLGSLSYHVKALLRLDMIEVVDQEQVRGAIKTRYRATSRMLLDEQAWNSLEKSTRSGISINAVNETIQRATNAIEKGTFDDRLDRSIANLKMDADEQAWNEAQEVIADAFDKLVKIEQEAAGRKAKGADTVRMTVSLLAYESPAMPEISPLRQALHQALSGRSAPMTTEELAALLNLPVSRVANHLGVLEKEGKVILGSSKEVGASSSSLGCAARRNSC